MGKNLQDDPWWAAHQPRDEEGRAWECYRGGGNGVERGTGQEKTEKRSGVLTVCMVGST